MVIFLTDDTGRPTRCASWLIARLWSRRVIAVNCRGSMLLALCIAIAALVFAGLPTTNTLMSFFALALMAAPCGLKIPPFADNKSLRSIPSLRGIAPTSKAISVSPKAMFGSSVITTSTRFGNAQSSNSIFTPPSAPRAGVTSSNCKITGVSAPSIAPEAIRNNRL